MRRQKKMNEKIECCFQFKSLCPFSAKPIQDTLSRFSSNPAKRTARRTVFSKFNNGSKVLSLREMKLNSIKFRGKVLWKNFGI